MFDAYVRRRGDELDDVVSTAWHTAGFSRMKRLKPLRDYLKRRKPAEPLRPPTREERKVVGAAAARFREQLNKPKAKRRRRTERVRKEVDDGGS